MVVSEGKPHNAAALALAVGQTVLKFGSSSSAVAFCRRAECCPHRDSNSGVVSRDWAMASPGLEPLCAYLGRQPIKIEPSQLWKADSSLYKLSVCLGFRLATFKLETEVLELGGQSGDELLELLERTVRIKRLS